MLKFATDEIELINPAKRLNPYRPAPSTKIYVKSNIKPSEDGGFEIALYERHPAHATPDNSEGELTIADVPVHCALTPRVAEKLNANLLVEITAAEFAEFQAAQLEKNKAARAARKEQARQNYIRAMGGTDTGFEAAWQELEGVSTLRNLL